MTHPIRSAMTLFFIVCGLSPLMALAQTPVSAIWANDGGDKITREELRGSSSPTRVFNSVWDGTKVKLFGAKNEIVGFNLVLEAATHEASKISVSFSRLIGPGGA